MSTTGFTSDYGPWAVVAGASEGIGESFSRQIAAAGINLVLVARRPDPLTALATSLESEFQIQTRPIALDLTDDDMCDRLADATSDIEVGLVVYNAGATHGAVRFHDEPVEKSLGLVRLNCTGPVQLTHHFGGLMRERGRGGIILLSSVSSVSGSARTATYSATKAFDVNLAEGLWAELKPLGVDVLALVAGATHTPAMERSGALIGSAEFPGMDPNDVAREGLANLANGPTWVAGDQNRATYDMLRALPKKDAVGFMSAGARTIYGLPDEP